MTFPFSKEQSDLILEEIGLEIDWGILLLYVKTPPDYLEGANSRLWDTPSEWAIVRVDDANHGIMIYGRYGKDGKWDTPWSSRHLVRLLITMMGHDLPMPQKETREILEAPGKIFPGAF